MMLYFRPREVQNNFLCAFSLKVREDSARQVARTKERCDTVRRSMQSQIADMERQLAQCRATARAAQKDRDEVNLICLEISNLQLNV